VQKPAAKLVKLFAALLVLGLIGIFAFKAQRHIAGLAKKDRPSAPAPTAAADDRFATASLSLDMLNALEAGRKVSRSSSSPTTCKTPRPFTCGVLC